MGEYADYLIEQGFDSLAMGEEIIEPDDGKVCKYCLKYPLYWQQVDGKWRLHEMDGSLHICEKYKKGGEDTP